MPLPPKAPAPDRNGTLHEPRPRSGREESEATRQRTSCHEGGSGGRARCGEELKHQIRLAVARVWRRALSLLDWFGPGCAALVFGKQVEPTRLMMTDVALLLQPLQAGIVGVQLEGLVEEVGPQNL